MFELTRIVTLIRQSDLLAKEPALFSTFSSHLLAMCLFECNRLEIVVKSDTLRQVDENVHNLNGCEDIAATA